MNPQINLSQLTVMQDSLRHTAQIPEMIDFVKNNGFWTQNTLKHFAEKYKLPRVCPVIEIISFPDGKYMVHDGHHRIVATYLGKRTYVRGDEYVFKFWKYEDYLEVNFANRWVTPFDPRIDIRIPDFGGFKKEVLDLAAVDEQAARDFIAAKKETYIMKRTISSVDDLVQSYLKNVSTITQGFIDDGKYFRTGN